ncbi:hypothetical protein IOCL2690_000303300 [Leishmania lindenbergi]|uniref:Uncharacterized protein n=1 Tax=Leishmania lindenbergi TaxID=651832 RepID=A0AAW3ALF8_9TRYP
MDASIFLLYGSTGPGCEHGATAAIIDHSTVSQQQRDVELAYPPYVWRHKAGDVVRSGEDSFTRPSTQWKSDEATMNAKQGLMEVLLHGGAVHHSRSSCVSAWGLP